MFLRTRATSGRHLTEAEAKDAILARNFATLDILLRRVESSRIAEAMFASLKALKGA